MKPVILGNGLLGSEIQKQTGWDILSRSIDGIDLTDITTWSHKLLKYNIIINCIAYTKTYDNERQIHWDVNYKAVAELVEYCNNYNKKLVHISTDHIYANSKSKASEIDVPVHLETWYGYTKLLGDAHVQLKSKNYLIIRESHKPYPFPYKIAWFNQYTNGDYVNVISKLIIDLINKNTDGVFNVGTKEKSWFDLTKEEFNTIPGVRPEKAPLDITMNINKMENELKSINK